MFNQIVDKVWHYLGWFGVMLVGAFLSACASGLVATFAAAAGTRFVFTTLSGLLMLLIGIAAGRRIGD